LSLRLDNRSGYDTEDLRRFIRRGLRACGVRGAIHVVVVASPIRCRGCAEVRGKKMVLAVAAPSHSTPKEFYRRLSRLIDHECAHLRGLEHKHMPEALLYSTGSRSEWSQGMTIRYLGRAPDQMAILRKDSRTKAKAKKRTRDFDKPALMRQIDKDDRAKNRHKVLDLRGKIARALQAKREGRPEVREYCMSERLKARERIRILREKLREEYRRYAYGERLGARGYCERAKRAPKLEIQRLRIALADERKFQEEMRRIAKGNRERQRTSRTTKTVSERRGESDDEVRSNIPEELIPLFNRVKRSIKAGKRLSRTEAFMKYAEEHPGEEYEAIEDKTDALVRRLESEQRSGRRDASRWKRRR